MVLKTSKPGHDGLNTGRTLRGSGRVLGRRYAFLRCSTASALPVDRAALDDLLGGLSTALPPDGVEFSLNKKGRWKIAECIRDELFPLADETDWQVKLLEHHLRPSSSSGRTCTAFYSNSGSQKSRTSERYMNAHSLGKEPKNANGGSRRRRRKSPADVDPTIAHSRLASEAEKSATDSGRVQLSCDVVRSVPSCSSAVYPSRQRPAKSRKQASPNKGRAFDSDFDCYDCGTAYDCSDAEMDSPDDELALIAVPSVAPPIERCASTEPHLEPLEPLGCGSGPSCSASAAGGTHPGGGSLSGVGRHGRSCNHPRAGSKDVGIGRGGSERKALAPRAAATASARARPTSAGSVHSPVTSGGNERVASVLPPAAWPLPGPLPVVVQIPCCSDDNGGDDDVMQQLSRTFGKLYSECGCQPRTCTVELRDTCRRVALACRCRRRARCQLSAYLVVQRLPDSRTTYSVWLSANLKVDVEIGILSSGATYTVQELVDRAEAFLLSLPHDRFTASVDVSGAAVSGKVISFGLLSAVRGWSVACLTLDDVQQELLANVARLQEENERNAKATSENLVLIPAVPQRSLSTCQTQCGSCFEQVGSTGVRALALSQCGHAFCLDCWRAYLTSKVADGCSLVQCPEHQCCALVDHATMLALCGPDVVWRYRMQQAEVMVWKQGNVKWCPNPYCRRLVRVQRERPQTEGRGEAVCISCTCGKSFCFECLSEPHWPLTCDQAGSYHAMLKQQGLFTVTSSVASSVHVRTKPCPACHHPIEKWIGCNHMQCTRCSAHFCWRCLAVLPSSGFYEHVNSCRLPAVEAQSHEFSATFTWSHGSLLASQAISNRMYKSADTMGHLQRKLSAMLGRIKLNTIGEYLSQVSSAPRSLPLLGELFAEARERLSKMVAFKLAAHHVVEHSLACLVMGPRTAASAASGSSIGVTGDRGASATAAAATVASTMQIRNRVRAELGRLAFALERLEALLGLLGAADGPQPSAHHLRRLDGLAAGGERSLSSLVRLVATYQGYCKQPPAASAAACSIRKGQRK